MTAELVQLDQPTTPPRARVLAAAWWRTLATRPNTQAAYTRDLTVWLDWCEARGLDPLTVTRAALVQLWLVDLAEAGDSDATRRRRLAAVSSWYRWLVREQVAGVNPMAQLDQVDRPPRHTSRPTPALSDEQAAALLDAADADPNPRTAALVYLLLSSGSRVGALLAADEDALTLDRGRTVLQLVIKGGRRLATPVDPDTFERVDRYMQARPDQRDRLPALAAGAAPARPLIATRTGRRLTRADVRRLLRRLAKAAELPAAVVDTIAPHTARATYITSNLAAGVPIYDVQRAVGHQSPTTTQGYDRSDQDPDRHPSAGTLRRYRAAGARASG